MATSEARIQANRQNAAKSTGPKTIEGKEASRRNSLKHGMTGQGIVLLEGDAAEVARRADVFAAELMAVGEVGQIVAQRAALNSVRMERGADRQAAALTLRIRQVEAEFTPPDGVDEAEADQLRAEAVRIAMFDPSKEATLARQYEAAAERGFYRALKQLRQMEQQAEALLKAEDAANQNALLGSFIEAQRADQELDDEFAALYPELGEGLPRWSAKSPQLPPTGRKVDVPITIGRSR